MTEVKRTLNESIIKIRVDLQNSKLKKTGHNKFQSFDYYELSDFLPKLNELMQSEGINDKFSIYNGEAVLTLIKGNETQEYKIPFQEYEVPLNKEDKPMMQAVQYLGAINTYCKRYLYINAFGITDGEIIDNMDNDNLNVQKKVTTSQQRKIIYIRDSQIDKIRELYSEEEINKALTLVNKKNIEELTIQEASSLISKRQKKDEVK